MHFSLHHIGRCGLVFLLDASLIIGCILFLITLVVVALGSCWMSAWSLDTFFLITLVVVALCSCWVPACSLDAFFFNHIGRCALSFSCDASLVVGCIFSESHCWVWLSLLVGCKPAHWMQAWSLDAFFLIKLLGFALLCFWMEGCSLDACLVGGCLFP